MCKKRCVCFCFLFSIHVSGNLCDFYENQPKELGSLRIFFFSHFSAMKLFEMSLAWERRRKIFICSATANSSLVKYSFVFERWRKPFVRIRYTRPRSLCYCCSSSCVGCCCWSFCHRRKSTNSYSSPYFFRAKAWWITEWIDEDIYFSRCLFLFGALRMCFGSVHMHTHTHTHTFIFDAIQFDLIIQVWRALFIQLWRFDIVCSANVCVCVCAKVTS